MTPEELAAQEAANNTSSTKDVKTSKVKSKKDAPEPSDIAAAAGKTEEYFAEQGAKSKSNLSQGGKEVEVSLTNKTLVRFTKNFGFLKKDHVQEISDVALAIYEKAGVIEKL